MQEYSSAKSDMKELYQIRRNYEKYSRLALDDEIGSKILEQKATKESVCNG